MQLFNRNEKTNDPYKGIEMGDRVKDTLSGFTGVVIARSEHMTGCNQLYVLPVSDKDNEVKEGHWFDVERIEKIEAAVIEVKPRLTGCDVPVPNRNTSAAR